MSRAGIPSDHAERCLGHVIGGVRGVYDRYEFHAEKKRAYEAGRANRADRQSSAQLCPDACSDERRERLAARGEHAAAGDASDRNGKARLFLDPFYFDVQAVSKLAAVALPRR
jgi:hypothetical protein